MRVLFIGDIVGRPGLLAVKSLVPKLRAERGVNVVIANAENVTNGSGCLPSAYRQLRESGVDLITLGDHVYKKSDIMELMPTEERLCRPANYPVASAGREFAFFMMPDGTKIAAICLLGRTFMRPVDCPFAAADRVLMQLSDAIVIVDAHAEATAEKYLFAHHLKGRVAAVLGTHTHVPTADEQIFPGGTAFICDVGMTGPYDGILGRKVEPVLKNALTFHPTTFDVAEGDVRLGGAIVDIDIATKRATAIERIAIPM